MKRSDERTQFLSDVIVTAIEGGVNYWAVVDQYQYIDDFSGNENKLVVYCGDQIGDQTHAVIKDQEEDNAPNLEISIDKIASALVKIFSNDELSLHESYRKRIAQASRENDCGLLDAYDCDIIVQVATLGDVIYG